jgi:hypothetical protein
MELLLMAIFFAYVMYAIFALVRNTLSLLSARRMPIGPGTFGWLAVLYVGSALAQLCVASVFVLYFFHADQEPLPFLVSLGALAFGVAAFVAMRRLRSQNLAPMGRIWRIW